MLNIFMFIISTLALSVLIFDWRSARKGVEPIFSAGTLRLILIYLVVIEVATQLTKLL